MSYKVTRKFLGKTEGFNSKEDKVLNQKMLKAYLKGEEMFRCGYESLDNGTRVPNWFLVLERKPMEGFENDTGL